MYVIRRIALAAFLVLAVATPHADASTSATEITDQWWNPAESGWGVNVILQNNVAFLTFFVYDAAQNPIWYTAVAYRTSDATLVWSGILYATKGPWFGGLFPPANVSEGQAGTATFAVANSNLNQATLTYSVDGVTVSKSVERQTWALENYSGNYAGGYSVRMTACNPSSLNGPQEVSGLLAVSQNGTSLSISAVGSIRTCAFSGAYSQTGKLGSAQGTYSCSDGTGGTFIMGQMTPTVAGFTAQVAGQNQYCQWSGYLGGITRAL